MTTIKLQTALKLIRFNHDDPEVREIIQATIDELDRLYKIEELFKENSQPVKAKLSQPGDKAICEMCGLEIVFVGPYWDHDTINAKPRHPAWPKEVAAPDNADWQAANAVVRK